jgi:hypothetical protein
LIYIKRIVLTSQPDRFRTRYPVRIGAILLRRTNIGLFFAVLHRAGASGASIRRV